MSARSASDSAGREKRHLLTVVVEDYFHATALNPLIPARHWTRLESRVVENTHRALDLLDEFDVRATFFVLGWIGEREPEIVREIVARGHEVASKGHAHRSLHEVSRTEFREDVRRSREVLEDASGARVIGYRVPEGSFGLDDLWALQVLAEEGFHYDSSIYPQFRSIAREPWRRFPHVQRCDGGLEILEFPISSLGTDNFLLRGAGGNYLRQLPSGLVRGAVAQWDRAYRSPFNMYFHVWELDPDLPRIAPAGWLTRIRQYRNLSKMPDRVRWFLAHHAFQGIRDLLGEEPELVQSRARPREEAAPQRVAPRASDARTPVTIVVPCFNEERVLPYLENALQELAASFAATYRVRFLLVDDASTDGTWDAMVRRFGSHPDYDLTRHPENRGVAAAILTGIRQAETEIVCSIDCDCSYDPHQLGALIPELKEGVALVTASPYHPLGSVLNVSPARLVLSRTLSRLYRLVLHHPFATYTSCFRVYRRSAVADLALRNGGFLGVAELLGELDLRGAKLVEVPAVLESRMLGRSKMSTIVTILGHLRLLARFGLRRVLGRGPQPAVQRSSS